MYYITLLSSFHFQHGACNSEELYKIIESIQPEVIFEELSIKGFDIVYSDDYIPKSIEAITIKKYLEKYPIKHFPVDTHVFYEDQLFDDYDRISNLSTEYTELLKQQFSMVGEQGYKFLNSDNSTYLIDRIHSIEESIITTLNDVSLFSRYKLDLELHQKREDEMLRNIYKYSEQNAYSKALFICGAEHRKPIIEKIYKLQKTKKNNLFWFFYSNPNI